MHQKSNTNRPTPSTRSRKTQNSSNTEKNVNALCLAQRPFTLTFKPWYGYFDSHTMPPYYRTPLNPKPLHHLKIYKYTTQEARQPQDIKKPLPKYSRQLSIRTMDTPFRGPTILALKSYLRGTLSLQSNRFKGLKPGAYQKAPRYFRSWTCQQLLRWTCQQPLRWIGNRSTYLSQHLQSC